MSAHRRAYGLAILQSTEEDTCETLNCPLLRKPDNDTRGMRVSWLRTRTRERGTT